MIIKTKQFTNQTPVLHYTAVMSRRYPFEKWVYEVQSGEYSHSDCEALVQNQYWYNVRLSNKLLRLDEHRSRIRVIDDFVTSTISPVNDTIQMKYLRPRFLYPRIRSIVMYNRKRCFGVILDGKLCAMSKVVAAKTFGFPKYGLIYSPGGRPRYLEM